MLDEVRLKDVLSSSHFTKQLDRQVELFRTAQNELAEARERYKEGSSTVNELARELAQVCQDGSAQRSNDSREEARESHSSYCVCVCTTLG